MHRHILRYIYKSVFYLKNMNDPNRQVGIVAGEIQPNLRQTYRLFIVAQTRRFKLAFRSLLYRVLEREAACRGVVISLLDIRILVVVKRI